MSEQTALFLATAATILPALFYAGLIYWADSYEKEPWWLLGAAFVWGAIPSIVLALLFNSLLNLPLMAVLDSTRAALFGGTIVAPVVEESVKGLALLGIFFFWRTEIDSPLDGIIYGAMVGMGFAMVENLYYFATVFAQQGIESWGVNIFLRAIVFGLNHALFSSMTGLGIALARLTTKPAVKILAPLAGWSTAVFLHALHNLTVTLGGGWWFLAVFFDWAGVMLITAIIVWAVLQERRWLKIYLAEEVRLRTLTAAQYSRTFSKPAVVRHRLDGLRDMGWSGYRARGHFYRRCSELAYKKHHYALFGDVQSAALIKELRAELRAQSRTVG